MVAKRRSSVIAVGVIFLISIRKYGWKVTEGKVILFSTLGAFGVFLWLLWNLLIFKDPLYFALGPFSAHAQQLQLEGAGNLATKHNLLLSFKMYWYALAYNSNAVILILGILGSIVLFCDKKIPGGVKIAISALYAPFIFNIIALYLGHSVLFIQGLSGNTWFNVRYGVLMMPSLAIFIGYLVHKAKSTRVSIIGLLLFVTAFTFLSGDAVTIDDARVGSSQKNVTEVSDWLKIHAKDTDGFVLISAASHDAIIFSSGLPMKRYIHEGTGVYWEEATVMPEKWARWIIMRTNDTGDLTYRAVSKSPGIAKYRLVESYPFADIYELKPEFLSALETKPILTQK